MLLSAVGTGVRNCGLLATPCEPCPAATDEDEKDCNSYQKLGVSIHHLGAQLFQVTVEGRSVVVSFFQAKDLLYLLKVINLLIIIPVKWVYARSCQI